MIGQNARRRLGWHCRWCSCESPCWKFHSSQESWAARFSSPSWNFETGFVETVSYLCTERPDTSRGKEVYNEVKHGLHTNTPFRFVKGQGWVGMVLYYPDWHTGGTKWPISLLSKVVEVVMVAPQSSGVFTSEDNSCWHSNASPTWTVLKVLFSGLFTQHWYSQNPSLLIAQNFVSRHYAIIRHLTTGAFPVDRSEKKVFYQLWHFYNCQKFTVQCLDSCFL